MVIKQMIEQALSASDLAEPLSFRLSNARAATFDPVKPQRALSTVLTFFDFPADHWDHLRTSNPIESVFATVRHRTVRMKGALSQDTARLMVFKLVMAASKTWRRLRGQNQLPKVIDGVKFKDGIERRSRYEIRRLTHSVTHFPA